MSNLKGAIEILGGDIDKVVRAIGEMQVRLGQDSPKFQEGLHRIGLTVFSFNERAIRSYQKSGFVPEGRAREAIWRGGRFWDEIAMSVLVSDWRARRGAGRLAPPVVSDEALAGQPAVRVSPG